MATCENCGKNIGENVQYCTGSGEHLLKRMRGNSTENDQSYREKLSRTLEAATADGLSIRNLLVGFGYYIGGPIFWLITVLYYFRVLEPPFKLSKLPGIPASKKWSRNEYGLIVIYLFIVFPAIWMLSLSIYFGAVGADFDDIESSQGGPGEVEGNGGSQAAEEGDRDEGGSGDGDGGSDGSDGSDSGDSGDQEYGTVPEGHVAGYMNVLEGAVTDASEVGTEVKLEPLRLDDGRTGIDATHQVETTEPNMMYVQTWDVLQAYITIIEEGHNVERMEVEVVQGGNTVTEYTVERELAEQYRANEISQEEFLDTVMIRMSL